MKKSIVSLFVFLAGFGMFTTSCEDMLTPEMDRYAENFNGTDTVNFYLGIMRNVQDMVEQNVLLSELRADLADTTMYSSDSLARIARYDASLKDGESTLLNRSAYYKVINQCNFYLAAADSNAVKNNVYFMRKEIAQVHMIRAWVYMQLVQLYGKVPFITKPVDNANTGWETNPEEGWATPENLLDLMEESLLKAAEFEKIYGLPNYGSFKTGKSGVDIPHKLMLFPSDLVLADLYLLRGRSLADYEKAAMYYYTWLEENARGRITQGTAAVYNIIEFDGQDPIVNSDPAPWYKSLTSYANNSETVVAIPSAANYSFGKVLTQIPMLCGFEVSSSNSTSASGETVATSGEINITPNAKKRQIGHSKRFEALNKSQLYLTLEMNKGLEEEGTVSKTKYYEVGDARFYGTVPKYETADDGVVQFIQKFGPAERGNSKAGDYYVNGQFSFIYEVPVYRLKQVWLRFAEAINRAGFPGYAFAIIRDGITYNKFPEFNYSIELDTLSKSVNDEGALVLNCRGTFTPDTTHMEANTINISPDELLRAQTKPYLDFSETDWRNIGIHALGCGKFESTDTVYVYNKVVGTRKQAILDRLGMYEPVPYAKKNGRVVTTPEEPTYTDTLVVIVDSVMVEPKPANNWEIEAVETLIADEMALELAFEGYRFFDLTRHARHKNNAGFDGTEWFAWMIANRSVNKAPYAPVEDGEIDEKDNALYNILLNQDNWYLPNPKY